SDNYYAETLLKNLGADFGGSGTTAAGAAVSRRQAARYGARPTIVDGSGLSRQNRTTPRDVVQLLDGLDESDIARPMRVSLSVAGKSGTLFGVSNLAGYCNAKSGARLAFAFLMSGVSTWTGHRLQDRMATALAKYRP